MWGLQLRISRDIFNLSDQGVYIYGIELRRITVFKIKNTEFSIFFLSYPRYTRLDTF